MLHPAFSYVMLSLLVNHQGSALNYWAMKAAVVEVSKRSWARFSDWIFITDEREERAYDRNETSQMITYRGLDFTRCVQDEPPRQLPPSTAFIRACSQKLTAAECAATYLLIVPHRRRGRKVLGPSPKHLATATNQLCVVLPELQVALGRD